MADYFPVLSRAVAGLETSTAETRQAVYDRARTAIVRQLRSINPPLPEDHIAREQAQLEEAIRRIEAEASGGGKTAAPPPPVRKPDAPTAAPARPAPVAAPPPAPKAAAPSRPAAERAETARPAVKAGSDTAGAAKPATAKPVAANAAASKPIPGEAKPAARTDGRPIIQAAGGPGRDAATKRSGPIVAIAALVAVLVGAGLFVARGQIAALFGGGSQSTGQQAATDPAATPQPATGDQKASDRLGQDAPSGASEEPARQAEQTPAAPETPQEVARAPEPTAPPPAESAAPAQPSAPAAPQAGPLVAQRAVLYEEGPNQQSGEASQGTVTWRTESVSGGPDQPLDTALRGDIEIPARKLRATLTIRRNIDATLPASHTIEIQFTLPEDFPNAGISNVPGVLMKADEAARGSAVSGLSVRVTSGFFLIGLSNMETERTVNEQLLRDRGWIDVPILYDNGRRAVLTLEKGNPGAQVFQEAFSAWRSASSQTPAAANP